MAYRRTAVCWQDMMDKDVKSKGFLFCQKIFTFFVDILEW